MDSTSDERVRNNTMRHQYRVLTDVEKRQMQTIKDAGDILLQAIVAAIEPLHPPDLDPREIEIARQKAEEAVMWACKYVTGPKPFAELAQQKVQLGPSDFS